MHRRLPVLVAFTSLLAAAAAVSNAWCFEADGIGCISQSLALASANASADFSGVVTTSSSSSPATPGGEARTASVADKPQDSSTAAAPARTASTSASGSGPATTGDDAGSATAPAATRKHELHWQSFLPGVIK